MHLLQLVELQKATKKKNISNFRKVEFSKRLVVMNWTQLDQKDFIKSCQEIFLVFLGKILPRCYQDLP